MADWELKITLRHLHFYSLTRQARVSDPLQTNPVSVGSGGWQWRVAVEGSGGCCGRKGARCGLDPQSPQT